MLSYPDYSRAKNVIFIIKTLSSSRALECSVYSVVQNVRFFPCFRIFHIFCILQYSVQSAIPPFRSIIPFPVHVVVNVVWLYYKWFVVESGSHKKLLANLIIIRTLRDRIQYYDTKYHNIENTFAKTSKWERWVTVIVELDYVLFRFNRPYSYSQYWTGTSLQSRLMRGNTLKSICIWKDFPALASIAS